MIITRARGAIVLAALLAAGCSAHDAARPALTQPHQLDTATICVNYGEGARCIDHPTKARSHALDTCAYAEHIHRLIAPLAQCIAAETNTPEDDDR